MKGTIVEKNIRGRIYLYRQYSWREGGKVRTKSTYLCPKGSSSAPSGELPHPIDDHVFGNPFLNLSPSLKKQRGASRTSDVSLVENLELLLPFAASAPALQGMWESFNKKLRKAGLGLNRDAKIVLRNGRKLGYTITREFGIVLTLPSHTDRANRNDIKKVYREALADLYLKHLAHAHPSHYRTFVSTCTGWKSAMNANLLTHVCRTGQSVSKLAVTLHYLANHQTPPEGPSSKAQHVPAEAKQAVASLMQYGYKTSLARLKKDKRNCDKRLKNATDRYYRKISPIGRLKKKGRELRAKIKAETKLATQLSYQEVMLHRLKDDVVCG